MNTLIEIIVAVIVTIITISCVLLHRFRNSNNERCTNHPISSTTTSDAGARGTTRVPEVLLQHARSCDRTVQDVAWDHDSMFSALADQLRVRNPHSRHTGQSLRQDTAKFAKNQRNSDPSDVQLEDNMWLQIVANFLRRRIILYRDDSNPAFLIQPDLYRAGHGMHELYLGRINNEHYVSLRPDQDDNVTDLDDDMEDDDSSTNQDYSSADQDDSNSDQDDSNADQDDSNSDQDDSNADQDDSGPDHCDICSDLDGDLTTPTPFLDGVCGEGQETRERQGSSSNAVYNADNPAVANELTADRPDEARELPVNDDNDTVNTTASCDKGATAHSDDDDDSNSDFEMVAVQIGDHNTSTINLTHREGCHVHRSVQILGYGEGHTVTLVINIPQSVVDFGNQRISEGAEVNDERISMKFEINGLDQDTTETAERRIINASEDIKQEVNLLIRHRGIDLVYVGSGCILLNFKPDTWMSAMHFVTDIYYEECMEIFATLFSACHSDFPACPVCNVELNVSRSNDDQYQKTTVHPSTQWRQDITDKMAQFYEGNGPASRRLHVPVRPANHGTEIVSRGAYSKLSVEAQFKAAAEAVQLSRIETAAEVVARSLRILGDSRPSHIEVDVDVTDSKKTKRMHQDRSEDEC